MGFTSVSATAKIEDSYGDSIENDENSTGMSFGVGIKSNNFIIEPTITQSDGASDFLIQFGIIIPQ